MTRTAYTTLRQGAQQMREHCAPVQIWRRLDELADALENGVNPLPRVEDKPESLPVMREDEAE